LNEAYAHCEAVARERARDRWLGALFAPAPLRPHLYALIAFEQEMAHLREAVRDPRAGEIRLVWWREAMAGTRDEALGNPLAAALLDTLRKFRPPPHLIENAIAARQFDLYDDPFPATVDLEAYLGETRSGLLQIAAFVLAEGRDSHSAEVSGLAGVALGLVELLRGMSGPRPLAFAPADLLARHGVSPAEFRERRASPGLTAAVGELVALARRRLREAEAARKLLPKALAPAYAGLATAPLWLAATERGHAPPEVAAWRRQWALWRWSRSL
jgi:15-cis-phytoene synthase